jgi:type II secretory pathway pseudopilin PulG
MFSLIVTVVAVALVAALALATIYYGGTISQLAMASANASVLANQGSQIYAASLLYEQDKGSWPASIDVLVTENYLSVPPVPPSGAYVQNSDSVLSEALAGNEPAVATDWTWVTDGSRNIWVQGKINEPTCHAVNQKYGLGFDIGQSINSDLVIQCFGTASPYTFVFLAPAGPDGKTVCHDIKGPALDNTGSGYNVDHPGAPIDCAAGPGVSGGGAPPPVAKPACFDLGTCAAPTRALSLVGHVFYDYLNWDTTDPQNPVLLSAEADDVLSGTDITTVCVADPLAKTDQTILSVQYGTVDLPIVELAPNGRTACANVVNPVSTLLGGPFSQATDFVATASVRDDRPGSPYGTYTATGSLTYIPTAVVEAGWSAATYCTLNGLSPDAGPAAGGTVITASGADVPTNAVVTFYLDAPPFTPQWLLAYQDPVSGEYYPGEAAGNLLAATDVHALSTTALTFKVPSSTPALANLTDRAATDAPYLTLPNRIGQGAGPYFQLAYVTCAEVGVGATDGEVPQQYNYAMPFITGVADGATKASLTINGSGFAPGAQSVFFDNRPAVVTAEAADGSSITVTPPSGGASLVGSIIRVRVSGRIDSNGVAAPFAPEARITFKNAQDIEITSASFSSTLANQDSVPFAVKLVNSGEATLTFNSNPHVDVNPTWDGPFRIGSSDCGWTVAPGGFCTLGIIFSPTVEGFNYTQAVQIDSNAANYPAPGQSSPSSLTLAGTAPYLPNPDSAQFPLEVRSDVPFVLPGTHMNSLTSFYVRDALNWTMVYEGTASETTLIAASFTIPGSPALDSAIPNGVCLSYGAPSAPCNIIPINVVAANTGITFVYGAMRAAPGDVITVDSIYAQGVPATAASPGVDFYAGVTTSPAFGLQMLTSAGNGALVVESSVGTFAFTNQSCQLASSQSRNYTACVALSGTWELTLLSNYEGSSVGVQGISLRNCTAGLSAPRPASHMEKVWNQVWDPLGARWVDNEWIGSNWAAGVGDPADPHAQDGNDSGVATYMCGAQSFSPGFEHSVDLSVYFFGSSGHVADAAFTLSQGAATSSYLPSYTASVDAAWPMIAYTYSVYHSAPESAGLRVHLGTNTYAAPFDLQDGYPILTVY